MTVMGRIEEVYKIMNDAVHPRMQDYYFFRSIKPILIILALYHLFVNKIGPDFMKERPAYKLKGVLTIYNLFQVFANLYIFCTGIVWLPHVNFVCHPIDDEDEDFNQMISKVALLYLYLKIFDLLDTVFFVLRKKNNQVSFLHLYHHTTIIVMTWFGGNYVPGGSSGLVGVFNLPVHVVMYTYYFLTGLDVNMDRWKKYVTQMQLIQHVSIFILFTINMFHPCSYPKPVAFLTMVNAAIFIYLFGKFYLNMYIRNPKKQNLKTK